MENWVALENLAGIGRVTCGWKRPELSLDAVRPYWRDAHSPAIARRHGVYEYRHYALDPVEPDLFAAIEGVERAPPADQQLMWLSDVRYRDQAGLDAFGASPGPQVKAQILADIEMIVDKSTTYLVLGDNGRTLVDSSGDPAPAGPAAHSYGVFLKQRGDEAGFRAHVRAMAARWAAGPGVRRLRLNLFEVPDMDAERKAGYPVKTHPPEMQYQAWIDLALAGPEAARGLMSPADGLDHAGHLRAVHAYPAPAVYTFNCAGRPTLAGLRGYPAMAAIRGLDAGHQRDPGLLRWMYGDVAPLEGVR
ncbi:hypothetical protein [Phenylobacterium sp.]|uniref:hypothetical protein n=1 Tax=Phenylobacterium sp. TaxID=1871053 RepID=UPI0025F2DFE4|nr:hypothetical protein [Phenylobacterium sp.]